MTDVKWIKLKVGMFDGESFKKIKRAKIGGESFRDKLTAIWFELMDFAGKCNHDGFLISAREIPYTSLDDIATMIDREPEELELCMRFYINEGMVEIVDDVYLLSNWMMYQNTAGLEKLREQRRIAQAKWRAKKKGLPEGVPVNEENDGSDVDVVDDVVDSTVDSTDHLPSYSISISTSTSTKEDKEGCGEEKKGRKKGEKKPVEQPPFDFSTTNFSPAMVSVVQNWLQYKTERREAYKPTGLQTLMTKIQNEVKLHGERAVANVITASMASNYQGIVWDRLQQQAPRGGGGNGQNDNVFLQMREERRGRA